MEKIGYLGPEGSYSNVAALKMSPSAELYAYPSFPRVMASLTTGHTDGIVLPIENSINGGVLQNMDLLQSADGVCAVREAVIKIDHRLATLKGADVKKITRVYSHPQALEQCAVYLAENFPFAELIPVRSTSAGIACISCDTDAGIVGAHVVNENLWLSEKNIADEDNNYTHFLLVKRGGVQEKIPTRKIYFSATCLNKSGALLALLQSIASRGLNLTKIESRPVKNIPDEYRFFIETEGDYSDPNIRLAIDEIKGSAISFKLLGCY